MQRKNRLSDKEFSDYLAIQKDIYKCNVVICSDYPLKWEIYHQRGLLYLSLRCYEQAINDFKEGLNLISHIHAYAATLHFNCGVAYFNSENYLAASINFALALCCNPVYAKAQFYQGFIFWVDGNRREALNCFLCALAMDPCEIAKQHGQKREGALEVEEIKPYFKRFSKYDVLYAIRSLPYEIAITLLEQLRNPNTLLGALCKWNAKNWLAKIPFEINYRILTAKGVDVLFAEKRDPHAGMEKTDNCHFNNRKKTDQLVSI